ncbi:MAG: macrolide family glycosyltransferase [Bryobacteraceae bacterium]
MAKALFLSLPLAGHINPSLSLVRELVGRGDEVFYYATDPFAARIEQAHSRYRPYRNAFLADMRQLPERTHELSWLLMRTTAEVLDEHLEAFRAQRPDYLITDSVAPWGQWAAEILGVPVVTSVSTFAFNRRVLAFAAARGIWPRSPRLIWSKLRHVVNALRLGRQLGRQHGVRGPGITGLVMGRSDLNIVYTSSHFQPCGETFDDRFQFIGPSLADRSETADFPWDQLSRPVIVYASLGTLFNTDATFYRKCFEAFRHEDLQVVLSIGSNVPSESLGPAPPNFIVQPHVPQLDLLQRAAVSITHGGMNSVSESLYHGVPVVVIPQMSEQAIIGRRVEDLGAGLYVAKEDVTADKLRESVQRLLSEDGFGRQAALVRESFRTAGGVARAADAILRFTRA